MSLDPDIGNDIELIRALREEAYYADRSNVKLAELLRDAANRIVELKNAKN